MAGTRPEQPSVRRSANAGDLNSDGVTDIVVGAPGEGRVHVFNGKTGGLFYTIVGPETELLTSFGAAVAGGQDFSKDKKPDIVVGAPLQSGSRGAVYVYNGTNGALIRRLKSPVSQDLRQIRGLGLRVARSDRR